MENKTQVWDGVAELYKDKFNDLDIYDNSYRHLLSNIKKDAAVLELACGPGTISQHIVKLRPDIHLLATDASKGMIESAKKLLPHTAFQLLNYKNISKLDKKYDAMVVGFLLPYIPEEDSKEFFLSCRNVLEADGVLYLSFMPADKNYTAIRTNSKQQKICLPVLSIRLH